jgi:hypothetical protein
MQHGWVHSSSFALECPGGELACHAGSAGAAKRSCGADLLGKRDGFDERNVSQRQGELAAAVA